MLANNQNLKCWYKQPAHSFLEALPLGNGKIGAMVYGGFPQEKISFNHDQLWSGMPSHYGNKESAKSLPLIRKMIEQKKYIEAQKIIEAQMLGPYTQSYLPMCDLEIEYLDCSKKDMKIYQRALHLQTSICQTVIGLENTLIEQEMFISYPDQCFCGLITSSKLGQLNVAIDLKSHWVQQLTSPEQGQLLLMGKVPYHAEPSYINAPNPLLMSPDRGKGMTFGVCIQVNTTDGYCVLENNRLIIRNSTQLWITLKADTSFIHYDALPIKRLNFTMNAMNLATYELLKIRHVKDFQNIFKRVDFQLMGQDYSQIPTDQRIQRFKYKQQDLGIFELYFQMGRYLIMTSSRKGTEAMTLQGIWNEDVRPPWSSNYTTNINLQMNYWPVEACHLSECFEPLHRLIAEIAVAGQKTAQDHLGCMGWVTHHNVDLWRLTTPVGGSASWAFWPMGGIWLCQHLVQHYLYTEDANYLEEIRPILYGAYLFMNDWLIQDQSGQWRTSPATSPENGYIDPSGSVCHVGHSTTMDIGLMRELAHNILLLNQSTEKPIVSDPMLHNFLAKLPAHQIDSSGYLQEWHEPFEEENSGHRHLSHLVELFPGNFLEQTKDREVIDAMEKSLLKRLDASNDATGWNSAWAINLFARLKRSDQTSRYLYQQIANATCPNLFNAHNPIGEDSLTDNLFQIDGNLGTLNGIVECLLQSRNQQIYLLPAVPVEWHTGAIKGLKAHGNIVVAMEWKKNRLKSAKIEGKPYQQVHIHFPEAEHYNFETDGSRKTAYTKQIKLTLDSKGKLIIGMPDQADINAKIW